MDTTNIKDAQGEIRENIITMFGIHKLPEGEQEEAINRLGKIIFQNVLIRVLPLLEEKDLKKYENLIESNVEADELMNFFFETVPGFLQIVTEESESFRIESAKVLDSLK